MEYLLLKFNPITKIFICRKIETPDLNTINEDVYLITVHLDAKEGKEYYQKIPQAKVALKIVPGYGTTNVHFYDLIDKSTRPINSEKFSWKSTPGVPDYIQETLNSRMAEITSRDEAIDNLALIIDLKAEFHQLKEQLNSLTDKLSKIAEFVN